MPISDALNQHPERVKTQCVEPLGNDLRKSLILLAAIAYGLCANTVQATQTNSSASAQSRIGITKLPPAPKMHAFSCEQGICATVTTGESVKSVVCEIRPDQLPACFYTPE